MDNKTYELGSLDNTLLNQLLKDDSIKDKFTTTSFLDIDLDKYISEE